MATNTVVAIAPGIASRIGLGLTEAGLVLSVWFFVRALAFLNLWLWPGWHYRFSWFIGSLLVLLANFVAIVLAGNIRLLLIAQLGFGLSSALLYYSSLYYSMVGSKTHKTHSEQGGIHEALIGIGIFCGPALSVVVQSFTCNSAAPAWVIAGALGVAVTMVFRIQRQSRFRMRQ